MPPRPRPNCEVCKKQPSKYACASCRADYCSVSCYKQHKEICQDSSSKGGYGASTAHPASIQDPKQARNLESITAPASANLESEPEPSNSLEIPKQTPLRPLTSLKWPYVPEESAYPDPLKRDDPKALQLHQYEAIATSPKIRTILNTHPSLPALLTHLDTLRGPSREEALQRALGVDSRLLRNDGDGDACERELDEDTRALRMLAEAVEEAVRGGREDALGLDWDD